MLEYQAAIMEIETRLKILNAEFSQEYKRNPFESIKSRLKSPESIYEKLERKGYPVTVESIQENLKDVAGVLQLPHNLLRIIHNLLIFQLVLQACPEIHSNRTGRARRRKRLSWSGKGNVS